MYDSSTGTERFCIRQLLKPLENVSQCIRDLTCILSDAFLLRLHTCCRLCILPMISLSLPERHRLRSS